MNLGKYLLRLRDVCADARSGGLRNSGALRRFLERYRWLFSGEEKRWLDACGCGALAYGLLQEQRAASNMPADPRRKILGNGSIARGVQALMMPSYFFATRPRSSRNGR